MAAFAYFVALDLPLDGNAVRLVYGRKADVDAAIRAATVVCSPGDAATLADAKSGNGGGWFYTGQHDEPARLIPLHATLYTAWRKRQPAHSWQGIATG